MTLVDGRMDGLYTRLASSFLVIQLIPIAVLPVLSQQLMATIGGKNLSLRWHERVYEKGHEEVQALRRTDASTLLWVHAIGSIRGTQRKHYNTAAFPIVAEPFEFQVRIKVAVLVLV